MVRFSFCLLLALAALPVFGQPQKPPKPQILYYHPFGSAPAASRQLNSHTIRPGQELTFDLGNINPFKYEVVISSSFFRVEYSTAPAAEPVVPAIVPVEDTSKNKGAAAPGSIAAKALMNERIRSATAARQQMTNVGTRYEAYRKLLGCLQNLYAQDTLPDNTATVLQPYATTAFDGDPNVITPSEFVSYPSLWKDQFNAAITEYTLKADAFAKDVTDYQKALDAADKALLKGSTAAKKAAVKAAKRQLYTADSLANKYPRLIFNEQAKERVKALQALLDSEAKQPTLPTLANVFVFLRSRTRAFSGPPPINIPHGKDELDVEIKLTLRSSYQQPPGIMLLGIPVAYKRTLYIVPRFRISASVGPYYARLADYTYVVAQADTVKGLVKLPTGTRPVASDSGYIARQKIVRDNPEQTWSYFGAAIFTHFELRMNTGFAAALTLGAGAQASGVRGLLGASLLFGNEQRGVITGGWAVGQVKRLSSVYTENTPMRPLSSSVVPTRDVIQWAPFVSLSYNLSSSRK